MNKRKLLIIIGSFVIYFLSTAVSYAFFSSSKISLSSSGLTSPLAEISAKPVNKFKIDPLIPRTEVCPLNGEKYTKQEKEVWETRRPLAVMIENHEEARPQSGLSYADIIYEAVAEGGTTRFMAVYYCGVAAGNLGVAPVRSTRTYFLPWVLEYDALYNHVGGAGRCIDETVDPRAKALCQIGQYGIKDMDQFGIGFPDCYRNPDRLDHPVATEHQMVCFTDNLYKIAKDRDWTNVDEEGVLWNKNFEPWKFKKEANLEERGNPAALEFNFWEGYKEYAVRWEYVKEENLYKRYNGGQPHKDLEGDIQLTAKNIVILFAKETGPVDDHGHLLYENIGGGKALISQDGKVVEGSWVKKTKTSRTKFFDKGGAEVAFNPGQIWIEMVPTGTKVSY